MSYRNSHTLKPNKTIERPTSIFFFDTETSQTDRRGRIKEHTLKLGHVMHVRTVNGQTLTLQKELAFTDAKTFWEFVTSRTRLKSINYLVAHNLVFDLTITGGFEYLANNGWTLESFYNKGVTSIFRWTKETRSLVGVDNQNLFPGTLKRWGELIDLPKLEIDFADTSDEYLAVYCRRDVEIMFKSWTNWIGFLDLHDCGSFCPTVGSTAFNTWKHRFNHTSVHIHNDLDALRLERESYKGGRVECLFQGKLEGRKFYYLDVNNMYGFVLARYEYPAGLSGVRDNPPLEFLHRKLERGSVIARVIVNVSRPCYPLKVNGHIAYPVGQFETTLTTPELLHAINKNYLVQVLSMSWYRSNSLFSEYVKYFHQLRAKYRQHNNPGYAEICKLLINSLYGKFGQQGFSQKVIGQSDPGEVWSYTGVNTVTGQYFKHICLAGSIFEETSSGESYNAFPGIAAHVTAYARMHLLRLLEMIPDRHVYYMDTDSLIVDDMGYQALKHLVHPTRLGSLKIELESDELTIHAPKDYILGDRIKIKGVKIGANQVAENTYTSEQWIQLNGLLQRGNLNNYTVRTFEKHQRRIIYSGLVQPSGWVEPFHLTLPSLQVGQVLFSQPLEQQ